MPGALIFGMRRLCATFALWKLKIIVIRKYCDRELLVEYEYVCSVQFQNENGQLMNAWFRENPEE